MTAPTYQQYKPAWSSQCLCGSGLKFRDCCRKRLPGRDIGEAWREPARKEQWQIALKHIRADITQYTIWHLSHTAPTHINLPGMPKSRLYKIDIEALSSYVGELCKAYHTIRNTGQLHSVLERLKDNIADKRWKHKIIYHQSIVPRQHSIDRLRFVNM